MIQLTKTRVFAPIGEVEKLRLEFRERNIVQATRFLDPELLSVVMRLVGEGKWTNNSGDFYREYVLEGVAREFLHFMVNRPDMLDLVQRISGLEPLTRFKGRIYRMVPDAGHVDSWHSDATEGRRVGMSINLSPCGYQGGVFQMRDDNSGRIVAEFANTGLGDMIMFPVVRGFSHQITEVTGAEPKTAFAGWFYLNEKSFWDWMREGKSGRA